MSHEHQHQQHTLVPTAAHKRKHNKKTSTTTPTPTPTAQFTTHKHVVPSHVPSSKFRMSSQFDEDENPSPPPVPSVVVNATYDLSVFPNVTNDDAVLPPPPEQQLFAKTDAAAIRSSSNNNLSGFIGVFAFMPVVLLGAWFLQGRVRRRWGYRHIDEAVHDDEEMRRL